MADDGDLVAIIGMACRFPGAGSPEEFWANLAAGVESLGPLDAQDGFDADFFGVTDSEALLLDPQQRVFLEICWAALEDAGYDPAGVPGAVGVYAGSSETDYAVALRTSRLPFVSDWQIRTATGLDFLTGRVAYKLGLRGPAVTVQTACSTSLVAMHLAAQALIGGDCDVALAGGVTVHPWPGEDQDDQGAGLLAADGHCRAFDAKADGTVFGNGAGAVVLKRLADARRDRDDVRAVLLGSAINNDGSQKIGFVAPSVAGQAMVIREAHLAAGIDPETIGYVEAHGTGTPLGDPIEVAALTSAFRRATHRTGFCPIGSVKSNIGHTDAAAGVAGVIKTVLAMRHGLLPPSVNFEAPNPEIDFQGGPFFVITEPRAWRRDHGPRRAGVSALGIGGTNAHLVLQEAPAGSVPTPPARPWHLLVVSGETETAAATAAARLGEHLRGHPEADLADVAWTLQTGRRAHRHRRFAVVADHASATDALAATHPAPAVTAVPSVAFAFPGQGGQHAGMARELYEHEPAFRAALDECAELAAEHLGADLRVLLHSGADQLDRMSVGQPAVFAVEYALACLLRQWGVRPDVVVGHSLGAYAAACVAGVFSLPDSMRLVVERGRLLHRVSTGAMLAVPLAEAEVAAVLATDPALDLAAVNGPAQCVVAGPGESLVALRHRLDATGVDARHLRISVPAHSRYVEPVIAEFEACLHELTLHPPRIPLLSDLTGRLLPAEEAVDPAYWVRHLRRTVRFGDALAHLFGAGDRVVVEVGPGQALTGLVRRHPDRPPGVVAVPVLGHPEEDTSEVVTLLTAVGRLWSAGVPVEWPAMHHGRTHRRVPLPTYPFQRRRYAVDPPSWVSADSVPDVVTAPAVAEPVGSTPAPTGTQARVAALFAQALGLPQVRPPDSFFALGGDSVIAAQLVRSVRHTFGIPLPLRAVFRNPTVIELARHIDDLVRPAPGGEGETP